MPFPFAAFFVKWLIGNYDIYYSIELDHLLANSINFGGDISIGCAMSTGTGKGTKKSFRLLLVVGAFECCNFKPVRYKIYMY